MSASAMLRELQSLRYDVGEAAAARELELLDALSTRRLPRADEVHDLHEVLCFLRAHAPNAAVRDAVGRMLAGFDQRKDLKRFARALADTGIAGTRLDFQFYWLTAIWLLRHGWAKHLTIDWKAFERRDQLADLLHLLLPFSDTVSLDTFDMATADWIDTLKREDETDAEFVIKRFESLRVATPLREKIYEDLDIPMLLAPGPTTPARSRDEWSGAPVVFPKQPLPAKRPDLKKAIRAVEFTVNKLDAREGRRMIDLANGCMVPRHRDLLIFLYADPNDVRMLDFGDGFQMSCCGAVPERRLMLESVYGFLMLHNGFPIGYVLCSALYGSAEVAYNVFETFRGRGAAHTYARVLAAVHQLFGVDTFAVDPYQLGHQNDEGLASGAWWFYYKLGFRPHDARVKKLVRAELAAMKRDASHRTERAQLNDLASEYMFLHLGKSRDDVLGQLSLGNIGLCISEHAGARHGGDRERGLQELARDVAVRLGHKKKLSGGEKLWWERWAPLVDVLPGVDRWSRAEKAALARVICAKGGPSEAAFVPLFDQHSKLRRGLLRLAE